MDGIIGWQGSSECNHVSDNDDKNKRNETIDRIINRLEELQVENYKLRTENQELKQEIKQLRGNLTFGEMLFNRERQKLTD